jgi:hypothetical protein
MLEYIIGLIVTIFIIFISFFMGNSRRKIRADSAPRTATMPVQTTPEIAFKDLNTSYEDKIAHLEGPQDAPGTEGNNPIVQEEHIKASKHTSKRKVRFSSRRKERIIDRNGKIIDRIGKT